MAKAKAPAQAGDAGEREKKACAITRAQFAKAPATLTIVINGVPLVAARKEFSTGGLGYYVNEKVPVEIDGVVVKIQSNCCLTVVNSKDAASG